MPKIENKQVILEDFEKDKFKETEKILQSIKKIIDANPEDFVETEVSEELGETLDYFWRLCSDILEGCGWY